MIYNKELLAIVKSFKMWRPELASVDSKRHMKMYIDHKYLEHFMTTKQLNCWQAHWAKFLSEFSFKISYRPGKQGKKPDILTHCSQNFLKNIEDLQQQHQFQILLQDHQLDKNIKKALAVTFCVNNAINKSVNETVDVNKENKKIINVKKFSDKFSEINNLFFTLLQQIISALIRDGEGEIDKTVKLLKELFEKLYKDNKMVKEIINAKICDL